HGESTIDLEVIDDVVVYRIQDLYRVLVAAAADGPVEDLPDVDDGHGEAHFAVVCPAEDFPDTRRAGLLLEKREERKAIEYVERLGGRCRHFRVGGSGGGGGRSRSSRSSSSARSSSRASVKEGPPLSMPYPASMGSSNAGITISCPLRSRILTSL